MSPKFVGESIIYTVDDFQFFYDYVFQFFFMIMFLSPLQPISVEILP